MGTRTLITEAPGIFVVVVPVFVCLFVCFNFHLFYFYSLWGISFWFYAGFVFFFPVLLLFVLFYFLFWFLFGLLFSCFFYLFCFIFSICFDFCLSVFFILFLDRPHGLPGSWILGWGLNPDSPQWECWVLAAGPPGNSQPQGVFLKEEKKKQMGLTPLGGSWRREVVISREAPSLFLKIRWNRRALRAIREECSSWSVASRREQDLQDGPCFNLRWCLPVLAGTGC